MHVIVDIAFDAFFFRDAKIFQVIKNRKDEGGGIASHRIGLQYISVILFVGSGKISNRF